ncbi:DUF6223 family protein [Dactylosporangium cerinum]|uniref:DUF6223 family protein n=1 Tax=Dactylosporangium cerinum TaxID=1434730 RepID=A0ABV9W506_9ACTN
MSVRLLLAESVSSSTLTTDRLVATVAAFVALAGAVTGVLALARGSRRRQFIALAAGAVGVVVGVLVLATADGGPGTGNGVVGGYAAIVFGLAAVVLGGLAVARSRRAA